MYNPAVFHRLKQRQKLENLAQTIAAQLITGTLPDEGVIACETPEQAQQLLTRVKQIVDAHSAK